jgi:hypothetical protein
MSGRIGQQFGIWILSLQQNATIVTGDTLVTLVVEANDEEWKGSNSDLRTVGSAIVSAYRRSRLDSTRLDSPTLMNRNDAAFRGSLCITHILYKSLNNYEPSTYSLLL